MAWCCGLAGDGVPVVVSRTHRGVVSRNARPTRPHPPRPPPERCRRRRPVTPAPPPPRVAVRRGSRDVHADPRLAQVSKEPQGESVVAKPWEFERRGLEGGHVDGLGVDVSLRGGGGPRKAARDGRGRASFHAGWLVAGSAALWAGALGLAGHRGAGGGLAGALAWPARAARGAAEGWRADVLESPLRALLALMAGAGAGLLVSLAKFLTLWARRRRNIAASVRPGVEYVRGVLDVWPRWVTMSDMERCEWLNRLLADAWPFLNKGVSDLVVEEIEPQVNAVTPAFIHGVEFRRINFGTRALRVDRVRVQRGETWLDGSVPAEMVVDAHLSWESDADIQLHVMTVLGLAQVLSKALSNNIGGVNIKVSDITVKAKVRVVLRPLVGGPPFVGGAALSFLEEPLFRYDTNLSGGVAVGGAAVAAAGRVISWIGQLVAEHLVKAYVWPDRFIVDLSDVARRHLPPGWGPHELEPRVTGVLDVVVVGADLEDDEPAGPCAVRGKARRLCLFVRASEDLTTSVARGNRPAWSERFRFLVKGPRWEKLHLVVTSDVGTVFARGVLHVDHFLSLVREHRPPGAAPGKGGGGGSGRGAGGDPGARGGLTSFGAHERMRGTGSGLPLRVSVPLGELTFQQGCGSGKGAVHLECRYNSAEYDGGCERGAVVVKIYSATGLPKMDLLGWCDAFVEVSCAGPPAPGARAGAPEAKRTPVRSVRDGSSTARFMAQMEWFDVPRDATVTITVKDRDRLSGSDVVGSRALSLRDDVIGSPRAVDGGLDDDFTLASGPGAAAGTTVTARVLWIGTDAGRSAPGRSFTRRRGRGGG